MNSRQEYKDIIKLLRKAQSRINILSTGQKNMQIDMEVMSEINKMIKQLTACNLEVAPKDKEEQIKELRLRNEELKKDLKPLLLAKMEKQLMDLGFKLPKKGERGGG